MNPNGVNPSSSTGRGRSRSRSRGRGRGQQSWQKKMNDSSSDCQMPVQADASSTGCMSNSLDGKRNSSWQVKGRNSDSVVSQKYENAASKNCHGQQQDSLIFEGECSLESRPHGPGKAKGHNADGVISQNKAKANATPVGCLGRKQDNSEFRSESNSNGGKAKSWIASSKGSSAVDYGDADYKQAGSSLVKEKVPIILNSRVMEAVDHVPDVSRLSLESVVETSHFDAGVVVLESSGKIRDHKDNEQSNCSTQVKAFDICPPKSSSVVKLKPTLFETNREKRIEMNKSLGGPEGIILRAGMVLLKNYLSSSEQARILKICRTHGLGSAGFYQPAYREGGELHLKMMCFGEFWDPETSKYWKVRPIDQAKPPSVPSEFLQLVDRAMKFSHSLIAEHSKVKNVENILPPVNPDICLVNYYAKIGRLGLHQDKDESRETLAKGIPIVSFSIGDSAEFLYSDQRDPENADKLILESGDVLIFGGKSRHIFHGVSKILPETAPKSLLESTNFRPGRLNLTFRQHL